MKARMTTFERRIEILFVLIKWKKSSITELANMFSVCRKTAYNDLIFLSRYAPIYTKNGIGGGVFMMQDYHNEIFMYLTEDEEKVLNELIEMLDTDKKIIVKNIINKFSMPKLSH